MISLTRIGREEIEQYLLREDHVYKKAHQECHVIDRMEI